MPRAGASNTHVFLNFGDHLGSSAVIVDKDTGEVVEDISYQAYGATESDYRPARWNAFREDLRFTGKEEDIEVGLQYFGARYYSPYLARFVSADPLSVHGFTGDPNPYAYVRGRVFNQTDALGLCEGEGCDRPDPPAGEEPSRAPSGGPPGWQKEVPPPPGSRGGVTHPILRDPYHPLPEPPPRTGPSYSGAALAVGNALLNSNPGLASTVHAITDPRGTASDYLRNFQLLPFGPSGRLIRGLVIPVIHGTVSGEEIVVDNSDVVLGAVDIGLALIGAHAPAAVAEGGGIARAAPSLSIDVDLLAQNGARVPTQSGGFYNVVTHADATSAYVVRNGQYAPISHRSLAQFIEGSAGYSGQPVRLLACEAGACNTGLGQNLANSLGVPVEAATGPVMVDGSGGFWTSGAWRLFTPGQ